MKIYILYEKFKVEFYGKLILAETLLKNFPEIEIIKLGWTRELIFELCQIKPKKNEKIIVINKDIWKQSEVLIDIFKEKGFFYISSHEEEYVMYSINNIKNYLNEIISKKYLLKMDNYLTLSKRTFYLMQKNMKNKKNMKIGGNLKYEYLNFAKKKNFFEKYKKKFYLITLSDSFFKHRHDYKLHHEKLKKYNLKNFKDDHYKDPTFDNALFYLCIKNQIKFYLKLAKKFNKFEFVVRPHPPDTMHIDLYKKIFCNLKNVTVEYKKDINYWILNCEALISGPSSVVIESIMAKKEAFLYYDNKNPIHNAIYKKHLSLKFKKNKLSNVNDFVPVFLKTKKNSLSHGKNIENYYPFTDKESKSYVDIIRNIKEKKVKNKKNFLFDYILNKIFVEIRKNRKKKNYSYKSYLKFKNKHKLSLSRLYFILKFYKNSYSYDFSNVLYKYCLGRNYHNHSKNLNSGEVDKINVKELNQFIKIYFNNNFMNKYKSKLTNKNKDLIIRK